MADGKGCVCLAYSSSECACDADWTPQEIYDLRKRLKTAIGGLRSIAYGDAQTWPNCSSREVAKQALLDCGGEKVSQATDLEGK